MSGPEPRLTVFLGTFDDRMEELETKPLAIRKRYVKLSIAGQCKSAWVRESAWRAVQAKRAIKHGMEK
jgi:hypothetical protein